MIFKTTIRLRLVATMSLLGLLIVVVGIGGLYGLSTVNASLRDVNTNSMPSTVAIANAQLAMARARLALDRVTMHPDTPDAEKILLRAQSLMADSDKAWASYLALPQDEEEQRLSNAVESQRKKFMEQGFLPLVAALKARDAVNADAITMNLMQPLFGRVVDTANALTAFQERSNLEHYEGSQAIYRKLKGFIVVAIIFSVAMIALASIALARAISVPINRVVNHFTGIAGGDLSARIGTGGHDEMAALLSGLAAMQGKLAATVRSVRDGTASITSATSEIAVGNLDLSRRTEQQAANLEMTAASLEQLTATVRQNAENARRSNQLARAASEVALKGGRIVSGVVSTMDAIRASSSRIEDIIGVIDSIAFQTNILALNAAVEAARAGEQGRGFAVVASEVRTLAHRSATAAKDIKALIGSSVVQINTGGELVSDAGVTMAEIVASIGRVAELMADISAAGQEQEVGIAQINQAVAELDSATQQNAALVEQAAAASESLRDQAEKLTNLVGSFRLAHVATAPLLEASRLG